MTYKNSSLYSVGKKYKDFIVTKALPLNELQCCLVELLHEPTGAQIIHIANDDPENLFCLSFRTLPYNSNGVAHILEHTVLCGSEKYPVKDPFFAMRRRSLHTFMNALTGPDFTCYPAASQVTKDFYNLLEVYLDAAFRPELKKLSFLQEGHRLEFAIPSDPSSPLERKGIVFNEMKGVLTAPTARLEEVINEALFPDLPYGFDSGGNPKVIPELTYQELRTFHKNNYHPSCCLFFFYGDMPLEGHLDFIAKNTLDKSEKILQQPLLPLQKRFDKPRYLNCTYPISAEEAIKDKTWIAFAWLTCPITEQQELLALNILEIVLMDTDASPLKLALLKSELCKQANSSLDDELSEAPFVITLSGSNPEHADQLEAQIRQTLQQVVEEGVPQSLIENAMHQLEFFRSEITGGQDPFGLSLFMRSALLKQHGVQPEDGLVIHSLFEQLRRNALDNPQYWTALIKKHLLNNKHFVRIIMTPSKDLAAKEEAEEKAELEKIRSALSEEKIKEIIKTSTELEAYQKLEEEEDIEVLPKITLKDIPPDSRDYPLTQESIGKLQVFHHNCFTNSIVYAGLSFDLPEISEEDLPMMRLMTTLMPQMGCGNRNYIDNLNYIQANTGGIGVFLTLSYHVEDYHRLHPTFQVRSKSLYRNVDKLFPLLKDIVTSVDFTDLPRLKEVILKHFTVLQGSINQNALRYAMNLAASGLDIGSKISNLCFGLEYYYRIKSLVANFDEEAPALIKKLQELQNKISSSERPHLILTCDNSMYTQLKKHKFYGLQDLSIPEQTPWKGNLTLLPTISQGRIIASPVAFTSKAFKTIPYRHVDSAALNIAINLFDNLALHPMIREQGGAYGGGSMCHSMSGNFFFYSYRDPNISTTLDAFESAVNSVLAGDFDERDLEEAKLEVIQSLDAPVAPGQRGDLAYSWYCEGKTIEIRREFRRRLLAATRDDVINAVKMHILTQSHKSSIAVFAGKELLEKENALMLTQNKPQFPIESI